MLDTEAWSNTQKIRFLAVLAFELTICARRTYDVGSSQVLETQVLRAFNELQHRVAAALRDHLLGRKAMAVPIVVEMVEQFAVQHDCQSVVGFAINRAQRLTAPKN